MGFFELFMTTPLYDLCSSTKQMSLSQIEEMAVTITLFIIDPLVSYTNLNLYIILQTCSASSVSETQWVTRTLGRLRGSLPRVMRRALLTPMCRSLATTPQWTSSVPCPVATGVLRTSQKSVSSCSVFGTGSHSSWRTTAATTPYRRCSTWHWSEFILCGLTVMFYF